MRSASRSVQRPDGSAEVDTHDTVQAADGTPIHVRHTGPRVLCAEVPSRLPRGEAVAPDAVYFRGTPRFGVPDGPHRWLSERLFVSRLPGDGDEVIVAVCGVT